MVQKRPHFLLLSEASDDNQHEGGRWHFLLESVDGGVVIEASDEEPNTEGERLELLAVVRGLEALDQPSRVTLVTPSSRVSKGFRHGLEQWRSNNWEWERFGQSVPVKNDDLWRRIDRALEYHSVECRTWRFDKAHSDHTQSKPQAFADQVRPANRRRFVIRHDIRKPVGAWIRRFRNAVHSAIDSPTPSIS